MRVPCSYRVGAFGMVVLSIYDFSTGLIDGVPKELLHFKPTDELTKIFSILTGDVNPSTKTTYNLLDEMTSNTVAKFVISDAGHHVYPISNLFITMKSTDGSSSAQLMANTSKNSVIFETEESKTIGFMRQPALSYRNGYTDTYFNVLTLKSGRKVYCDGASIIDVDFEYEEKLTPLMLKPTALAFNTDETVIGVVQYNSTPKYIHTKRRLQDVI